MMIMHSNALDIAVVPLTNTMHEQAEQRCPSQFSLAQSESIYLNALSVLAVDHYLKRLGYLTQLKLEIIGNPLLRSLMDSAPIEVLAPADSTVKDDRAAQQDYGLLECRYIMPTEQTMHVPESVLNLERLGCLAVQFNDDLDEARILGYVQSMDIRQTDFNRTDFNPENTSDKAIKGVEVPLAELRSLDTFCVYLESSQPAPVIDLLQWFDHVFQKGWELVNSVIPPQQIALAASRFKVTEQRVERGQVVTIGDRGDQVSLVLSVKQQPGQQFGISVEFWPVNSLYLPSDLYLAILDDQDQAVLKTKTETATPKAEITFDADRGDRFQVRIENGKTSVIYQFTL